MKKFVVLGLALVFFSWVGCASQRSLKSSQEKHEIETLAEEIRGESDQLVAVQKNLMESLEKKAAKEIEFKPVMPKYNPLDDQNVSFSMVGEDMQLVLYSLAKAVGMNLILAPELMEEKYKITLSFENVAASTVLDEMLETYDLYYEINENVIRVKPYEERIFTQPLMWGAMFSGQAKLRPLQVFQETSSFQVKAQGRQMRTTP
ncbi:MAG: STN domain-containing protein [Deltaproteobacteria bacterium]|nr:STN domain-containing protein [Deltaproteobacteria bacterium]